MKTVKKEHASTSKTAKSAGAHAGAHPAKAKHPRREEEEVAIAHAPTETTDALGGDGMTDATDEGAPLTPEQQATATQALARVKPRAMALRADEILPYRLIPSVANANVIRLKFGLARFRPEIPRALPLVDLQAYDAMEDTSLALIAAAANGDKVASDGETRTSARAAAKPRAGAARRESASGPDPADPEAAQARPRLSGVRAEGRAAPCLPVPIPIEGR